MVSFVLPGHQLDGVATGQPKTLTSHTFEYGNLETDIILIGVTFVLCVRYLRIMWSSYVNY